MSHYTLISVTPLDNVCNKDNKALKRAFNIAKNSDMEQFKVGSTICGGTGKHYIKGF